MQEDHGCVETDSRGRQVCTSLYTVHMDTSAVEFPIIVAHTKTDDARCLACVVDSLRVNQSLNAVCRHFLDALAMVDLFVSSFCPCLET